MGRTLHRMSIGTLGMLGAVATLSVSGVAGAGAAGPAPRATVCAAVPFSWSGSATVAAGASFGTGTAVPSELGVQLRVNAFDVSTIDPAPGVLGVRVGSDAVAGGSAITGGEIAVTNTGAVPVVVTRVELSVDRCYQVESAPAAPVPATAAPAAATPPAAATVAAGVESAPAVPEGGLPETGQASIAVAALALACSLAGGGLLLVRRRRPQPALVRVTGRGRAR